jgi:hypothetical protein
MAGLGNLTGLEDRDSLGHRLTIPDEHFDRFPVNAVVFEERDDQTANSAGIRYEKVLEFYIAGIHFLLVEEIHVAQKVKVEGVNGIQGLFLECFAGQEPELAGLDPSGFGGVAEELEGVLDAFREEEADGGREGRDHEKVAVESDQSVGREGETAAHEGVVDAGKDVAGMEVRGFLVGLGHRLHLASSAETSKLEEIKMERAATV